MVLSRITGFTQELTLLALFFRKGNFSVSALAVLFSQHPKEY